MNHDSNDFKFYIRFGVHKDRDVIRELNSSIAGVCVPAHIFSYSPEPTVYAALTIDKSYFIDPMTYIYSDQDIADYVTVEKKSGSRQFKPSVKKLTDDYGLTDYFVARNFARLQVEDMTDEMIATWAQKNITLQYEKLENNKDSTIRRYAAMFTEMGMNDLAAISEAEHKPMFIVPPYFFFASPQDGWLNVNIKLAQKTKELKMDVEVVPFILTKSSCLDASLLKKYQEAGFSKVFIWIDDLNEKKALNSENGSHLASLKSLRDFIKEAHEKHVEVYNLYGGYFSILLSKHGLKGICNGVFYGEHKSRKSNVGGGPQARYYIRKLHEFFSLEQAMSMLGHPSGKDLLDTESKKCMELIKGKVSNIFLFDADHSLAQRHFIYSRLAELDSVQRNELARLVAELKTSAKRYPPVLETYSKNSKKLDYLDLWASVLSPGEEEVSSS